MNALLALSLFEAALARAPDERTGFIEREAGDDEVLRNGALALLAAHSASEGFLEPVVPDFASRELGPYRLIESIGVGGMGQVYLAERRDGAFEQRVAIKVMASALGDSDAIRRAEAERQFLAWLEHPNIARVLDGGSTAEGQPYVVMEYVDGERIDAWCRRHALDVKSRVRLFAQVIDAVDAAHRALIIHRDIKPANVLVTEQGAVKLLDFGIAKSLDGRTHGAATQAGSGPMTPDYASPEQFAGKPLTTACDVYTLGLVLYELLAGRAAFERGRLTLVDFARRVTSEMPTRPSARVDAASLALSPRALPAWRRRLLGDLDRIVLKALETEPERRYASARAFGDDLARWLDNRPVVARSPSVGYRTLKFVRRNRLPVAASLIAVLALVIGLGTAAMQARVAREEAERAQRANRFLLSMIERADPFVSGRNPTLIEALDRAAGDIPTQFANQPRLEADVRHAIGRAYLSLERLDEAETQLLRAEQLRSDQGGKALAETLDSLAMLDWSRGRYDVAEQRLQRALALVEPINAPETLAVILNDYGTLLNELGRYAESRPLFERALAISASSVELPPKERAVFRSNLAFALHGLGELQASSDAYVVSRRELEGVLSTRHPDIAINLNNHAAALRDMGRNGEAVPLLERSIAIRRELFGAEHPMSVTSLSNLALVYASVGRAEDARAAIDTALANAPRAFDPNNQTLGHVHFTAARIALLLGDTDDAIRLAQLALSIYARLDTVEEGRRERTEAFIREAEAKRSEAGA